MKTNIFFLLIATTILPTIVRPEASTSTTTYTLNIGSEPTITETKTSVSPRDKKQGLKALAKKYCVSILTGSMIGGATGYLERYIEKQFEVSFPITLFFMLIESGVRVETLNAIVKDFGEYGIPHSKQLTIFASSLVSWFAYFR